jgi:hypothetical protein
VLSRNRALESGAAFQFLQQREFNPVLSCDYKCLKCDLVIAVALTRSQ